MGRRSLIYGIGINDANYEVYTTVEGKQTCCPLYTVWKSMLQRCYSDKWLAKYPTYKGCKVCNIWLSFMAFRSWMETQDWQDKQLDKDLIGDGKLYSPETCCFVEPWLNKLFNENLAKRGEWPLGVHWSERDSIFISSLRVDGKLQHLGCFNDCLEAHLTYLKARVKYIIEKMQDYSNPRVVEAVLNKANKPCVCEFCK